MKRVCIYIHHSLDNNIPYYVDMYVTELLNYVDVLIFNYDNNKLIQSIKSDKLKYYYTDNIGYDFGKLYKTINQFNLYDNYDELLFVNDSNIMINKLDNIFNISNTFDCDLCGITDSCENPPGLDKNKSYHIQSHFLFFKNNGIKYLKNFYEQSNINTILKHNSDNIRRVVIDNYEIGLSQYFLNNNLKIKSIFSIKDFHKLLSYKQINTINIYLHMWKELIENGYPFIKKRIIDTRFKPNEIDLNIFNDLDMVLNKYTNPLYNKNKLII